MFCIDKATTFLTNERHLKSAAQWIYNEKIDIDGEELSCELTDEQKYTIVRNYFASKHFTLDEKKDLLIKTFEKDQSDAGKTTQKLCNWCLPDPALKEQLWNEITDEDTKDSPIDLKTKVQGFW